VLVQTGLLTLLRSLNQVSPPLWALASLPLLRALLTLSALVWPHWGQHPRLRHLTQTLADLQRALLLTLSLGLLRGQLLATSSGLLAAVVTPPRRPNPTASGRMLADGTYEGILGDQFAIRHTPVDEFDRRMCLRFLRDIHLVERPSKWPFLCQVWLADWFGPLQELLSRWELALRAKGYVPQGIVTDLCPDDDRAVPAVFPRAIHPQCIFHALQAWHGQLRDAYGACRFTSSCAACVSAGQVLLM